MESGWNQLRWPVPGIGFVLLTRADTRSYRARKLILRNSAYVMLAAALSFFQDYPCIDRIATHIGSRIRQCASSGAIHQKG